MILYYRLMTKWSGLGDSTDLSRMGLSQQPQLTSRKDILPQSFSLFSSENVRDLSPDIGVKVGMAAERGNPGDARVYRNHEKNRKWEKWGKR
jgi:hypothetical protein